MFHTHLCSHSSDRMGVVHQKWLNEHSAAHRETAGNSIKILAPTALTLKGEGQIPDEINTCIIYSVLGGEGAELSVKARSKIAILNKVVKEAFPRR